MRPFFALLVFALLVCALAGASFSQIVPGTAQERRRMAFWAKIGSTYDATRRAAARLKAGRPVDDLQAELLASAYFDRYISGCGGPGLGSDKGTYWLFSSRVGDAGFPGPEVRVEKTTGKTSSKGLPTVTDPKSYLVPEPRKGKHQAAVSGAGVDRTRGLGVPWSSFSPATTSGAGTGWSTRL